MGIAHRVAEKLLRNQTTFEMDSINKLADAPAVRPTHQAILGLHNEQQANRKYMIGGLFLIMAFSAATFGLTLGAAEFSKESTVSSDGALLVKGTTQAVKTAPLETILVPLDHNLSPQEIMNMPHLVVTKKGVEQADRVVSYEAVKGVEQTANGLKITTEKGTYELPVPEGDNTELSYPTNSEVSRAEGTDKIASLFTCYFDWQCGSG